MSDNNKASKHGLLINVSRVGEHFKHCCERYSVYSVLDNPERIGWDKRDKSHTAAQDAGHIWEWDTLCFLADRYIPCYAEKKVKNSEETEPVTDYHAMREICVANKKDGEEGYADISVEKTIAVLKEPEKYIEGYDKKGIGYIYQATLECQDGFLEKILPADDEHREFLHEVFTDRNPVINAKFGVCKPDFIVVKKGENGIPLFSIVDVKHAKHARMAHKVQVAVYAKLLNILLEYRNIPGKADCEKGYLWNFKKEEPIAFDMTVVMPYVEKYFEKDMPRAVMNLADCLGSNDVDIYNKTFSALPSVQCEWCDNLESCVKWQKIHEPVTLMPYLSTYSKLYARRQGVPMDIDGFEKYIAVPENQLTLKNGCLGWQRMLRTAEQNIKALKEKVLVDNDDAEEKQLFAEPVSKKVSSLIMPVYEDIRIILTAQRDEATDRVYALGMFVDTGKKEISFEESGLEKIEKYPAYERVFIASSPDRIDGTIRSFVDCLYNVLKKCSDFNNEHKNFQDQISVQSYVMDSYENINLSEMILDELLSGDGIRDTDYSEKLVSILFWLMGERMITDSDDQPESLGVDFPLVIITDVIKALFCIPAYISYDMETVCDSLIGSKSNKKIYKKIFKYNHTLSNAMKSDAINDLWDNPSKDSGMILEGIMTHISIRLHAEDALVRGIRNKSDNILKRWPGKFHLPEMDSRLSLRASKLLTEHRYEELLAYNRIRQIRMNDLEEMAQEGRIMKVQITSQKTIMKNTFPRERDGYQCECVLLNSDSYFLKDMFRGIMLKAGDEIALDELMRLDIKREGKNLPQIDTESGIKRLYTVDNFDSYSENGVRKYSFERFAGEYDFGLVTENSVFYIVESYKDLNGSKTENALLEEGKCDTEGTVSALYPETIYTSKNMPHPQKQDMVLTNDDQNECLSYKPFDSNKDFTVSQMRAFRQLFLRNVTLLLGPPGTGKTDFIARALITLCKYYKSKGQNISVLLSANSHSAINNMLSALKQKEEGAKDEPLLYKLGRWGDDNDDELSGVTLVKDYCESSEDKPSEIVYSFKGGKPVILGATCWTAKKSINGYNDNPSFIPFAGYDIVVIDEASQVRTMDALLMMQTAKRDARFLIVGDEDQLSPVLLGKYDAKDQPVDFYASVFRLFYDTAIEKELDYKVILEEQFRMNEILSRYSAVSIYDRDMREGDGRSGYHAFDFGKKKSLGIADQKLTLMPNGGLLSEDPYEAKMIDEILDPDFPLVVCRIYGGDAGEKRDKEIKLVTKLVSVLKNRMCVPGTDALYADEKEFWGSGDSEGGLGIISPHHEQINRLKDAIEKETGMSRHALFIGTVDKLQGRQREAVIVSYGVTDPEKAASEMEFIYSRNRLNVALTRGKKKTICILSDTLLDSRVETLDVDDEETLKGISYMTGLLEFMQKEESDTFVSNFKGLPIGGSKIDVYKKKIR